jgi:diguanylate cyclase (GGDEF)-like protein
MKAHDRQEAFEGSLLLVDIDHFKHVNDTRGHAAGDEVLIEIGRRLAEAVRAHDLVVRWGGEEFLIYAPALTADAIDAFAGRLLHAIGDAPVTALGEPLRITASVGHAHFPLAPAQLPLGWERAVNLIDMALYTAKSLGRNRAAGIAGVAVADDEAMRHVEADFERAWTDGVVTLTLIEGPGEASPVAAAA